MAKRTAKKDIEKSIPEIADDLAKMTMKGMSAKEMKEWAEIFKDI